MDESKREIEQLMTEYEVVKARRDIAWADYQRLSAEADALYRRTYPLWEKRLGFPCTPPDV